MSVKEKKEKTSLLEKEVQKPEDQGAKPSPSRASGSRKAGEGRKTSPPQRGRSKRFAKDRANTVGKEQGARYLALAIVGLFLPPLAPVAWLLSQALRSFARTHGFLLDNRIYAAWVLGLISTIVYTLCLVAIALQYLLLPGYSLFGV